MSAPTQPTTPLGRPCRFISASGALKRGHQPSVFLMGEAVYLMKGEVIDQVHGVGFPPLRQLFDEIIGAKVPIYI